MNNNELRILEPIEAKHRRVTQPFNDNFKWGWKWMYWEIIKAWSWHAGIDYTSRENKTWAVKPLPIRAWFKGTVSNKVNNATYGNYCEIVSEDGEYLLVYWHLDSFEWESREVEMWDIIGYTGNTGAHSTSAHLHFWLCHNPRNREEWISWWIDQTEMLIDDDEMEPQEPKSLFEEWLETDRVLVSDETVLWLDNVISNKYRTPMFTNEDKSIIYAEIEWVNYSWVLDEAKNADKQEIDSIPEDAIEIEAEAEVEPID